MSVERVYVHDLVSKKTYPTSLKCDSYGSITNEHFALQKANELNMREVDDSSGCVLVYFVRRESASV